jgi:hypothetical protein
VGPGKLLAHNLQGNQPFTLHLECWDYSGQPNKGAKPTGLKWLPLALRSSETGVIPVPSGTTTIVLRKGQILRDGKVLVDLRGAEFEAMQAPYPAAV